MSDLPNVTIFTDGACKGNPGPGGWGALLVWGDREKELCGGEPATTNNRMELTAVIRALESLKRGFMGAVSEGIDDAGVVAELACGAGQRGLGAVAATGAKDEQSHE